MPDGAADRERIFDFRTVVLTCAQLPHFIERFNLERSCQLSSPLDDLIDDAWVLDLHVEDRRARERARLIAAFVVFVDRTVWQPYVQKWRG
jgi:hypothetical protein